MEEQMERHNPVRGGAAVPSMGLSQFRGGAMEGCGDSESDEEMVGGSRVVGGRRRRRRMSEEMEGGGPIGEFITRQLKKLLGSFGSQYAKNRAADIRKQDEVFRQKQMRQKPIYGYEGAGAGMNEATQMGLHLGKHLHSLHGAGFWDDFKSGFNAVVAPVAGVAKSILPILGPEGMAASGVINALGYGHAKRGARGRPRKGGATNSDTGAYEGHGRERDDRAFTGLGTGAGLLGENGHGIRMGGRRRRAPAGPSDGRRRRAEIVKRVMAERGLSMIEASKAVKAEGLY
jgi:hypothetical protein